MPENQGTYEAYTYIEVELPDGETMEAKPLPLDRSIHYLRLLDEASTHGNEALIRIIEDFPQEFDRDVRKKLESLNPFEVVATARRFLSASRTPPGAQRTASEMVEALREAMESATASTT